MIYDKTTYWRETQRPARFFFLDARIVIFIGLALVHIRLWTVCLLAMAAITLFVMERKGINPANAGRHLRTWLAGPVVPARRFGDLRTPTGYGCYPVD